MLTRQGWAVVWTGLALFGVGRLFGLGQLYVFGAVAMLLVLGTLAYVHLTQLDLEVSRRVHPSRVHAGSTSRVEIRVRNLRRYPTPLLALHDQVSGTEGASLLLPPLESRGEASTSYRLPTSRRGVLHVGPLRVIVADPFGLAQSAVEAAPKVEATVYPQVDQVLPTPFTAGHDPLAGAPRAHALSPSGGDFYALRPYVLGDDLRRIHWPSTARHDELLVRQHEEPWQGRTTVLLDVNDAGYAPDSFEVAVSAAASVVSANSKRYDLVRLVTTDGRDSGLGTGHIHLESMLEHLALVQPNRAAGLTSVVDVLQRSKGSGGAFVVIAGDLAGDWAVALARLRSRLGSLTLVQVERTAALHGRRSRPDPGWASSPRAASGLPTISVNDAAPFSLVWNHALGRRQNTAATSIHGTPSR